MGFDHGTAPVFQFDGAGRCFGTASCEPKGSSTGGPQALIAVLTRLPANFPVPIVFDLIVEDVLILEL
jgi:hypothetical protein